MAVRTQIKRQTDSQHARFMQNVAKQLVGQQQQTTAC